MSAWPGKFVIGLTGNIATGKSVVRRMLEHLGAYGIDADALAHRVIAQDAPGYKPVIDTFGRWILAEDGQIDRTRLGRIVFSNPEALQELESIVHPLVSQALDILVKRARQEVVVIEAIKLIESGLAAWCDTLWVTYTPQEVQVARLVDKRGLKESDARQRITAQPSQGRKIGQADVIIRNHRTFDDTWRQVLAAWGKYVPQFVAEAEAPSPTVTGQLTSERARPQQAAEIAAFVSQHSNGKLVMSREDVMAAFGEKAFLLLRRGQELVGVAGWQVENLVARAADIILHPEVPLVDGLSTVLNHIENASTELQCEVLLLFASPDLAQQLTIWQRLGYQKRSIDSLEARAWQEAARESIPPGTVMFFKQLRKDRVLRPV